MSRKIFVGGLNWSTSEATLQNTFQRFGNIQSIKLVIDQNTGRSKGYAFITFDDDMAAHVAMSQMNGRQIEGRVIKVNHAFERTEGNEDEDDQRAQVWDIDENCENVSPMIKNTKPKQLREATNERVYIGGMDWNTTEETIRQNFEEFGDIEEIKIVCDRDTGQSKGFGFITFSDQDSAEHAIQKMNGATLDGRVIKVNKAQYKNSHNNDNQRAKHGNRSQRRSNQQFNRFGR